VAVAALLVLAVAAPAHAATDYAPLNRKGPPLTVSAATVAAATKCSSGVEHAKRQPVLLSPATGVTADQNYSWNYERAFNARGIPWCQVTMPMHTLADIQVSAEYLVRSIRTLNARAGRKIAVMGHSQGGMSMRWVLRFWPDTRSRVDDIVGWAGSNHGTEAGASDCSSGCTPASWQQGAKSNFIAALNSRAETFPGISYTEVYTHRDEVVTPNQDDSGSSSLHGGGGQITNVAIQDICPADVNEHLQIGTVDPAAYALAIDALEHPGPAKESRIPASVCAQPYQPGVDPSNANMYIQILAGAPGLGAVATPVNVVGVPTPKTEPPLRCYVFAGCPQGFATVTCLDAHGAATGGRLGPARLNRARPRVRSSLGPKRNRKTRRGLDRYCVAGGGIYEVGYPTKRLTRAQRRAAKGRAILLLSSSKRLTVRGIRRGTSVRRLRARLHGERRYRVGLNTWYAASAKGSVLVFKTRHGKVLAAGIGSRKLMSTRVASRRFLRAWQL
jgi:Lipase (class 2)